jgi:hypothetical protein
MQMKTLFLVGSAIQTKHGVHDTQARLKQTLRTLESISERVMDPLIIIQESSGAESITQEMIEQLSQYADYIINYHNDSQVQVVYQTIPNVDILKSYTEMLVTLKTLDYIQKMNLLDGIDRVFKISGRYELTDDFKLDNFADPDKFIFARRKASQFPPAVTNGLSEQLMSRLWSWPANRTREVFETYKFMLEGFVMGIQKGFYIDIEHSLLAHFKSEDIQELDKIGVKGPLGPNGQIVQD